MKKVPGITNTQPVRNMDEKHNEYRNFMQMPPSPFPLPAAYLE
jgi:hypothetical protein